MPGFTIPMPPLADVFFPTHMLKIPVMSSDLLKGMAHEHYLRFAFSASDHVAGAAVTSPPCYYGPVSTLKAHGDSAKEVGKLHKDFVHEALDKIKSALDTWKPKAELKSLKINALTSLGTPGCFDAPDIKNEPSFSSWKGKEDNAKAYIKAVVTGFDACWMGWAKGVTVPALPWWPAFCAFPLAMAPPMPNIPMPLITLISSQVAKTTVFTQLADAMIKELDGGVKKKDKDKQYEAIFKTIAYPVATACLAWLGMQMVMNVLGKGPVPPYAPPYVPVGPIVMGGEAMGKACIAA